MKHISMILFACLLPPLLSTCSAEARNKPAAVVPFELCVNQIFFRATINGSKPLWFLLDTGAEDTTVTERAALELGFSLGNKVATGGFVGGDGFADVAYLHDVTLGIGTISLPLRENVITVPFGPMEAITGRRIDGVAGCEVFRNFVVRVDFTAGKLEFFEPKTYRYEGSGAIVPLGIYGVPYAKATIAFKDGRKTDGVFMIDSGHTGSVTFTSPFSRLYDLPSAAGKTLPEIGVGGGGSSVRRSGRIGDLVIGGQTIEDPVVSISSDANGGLARSDFSGILGNGILKRFTVTFDYPGNRMILEPNASYDEREETDMSGLFLYAKGDAFDRILVYDVIDGSPADRAGIRTGDVLDSVDGIPAATRSLDNIRALFREDGKRVRLGLIRDGEELTFELTLERLI